MTCWVVYLKVHTLLKYLLYLQGLDPEFEFPSGKKGNGHIFHPFLKETQISISDLGMKA